MMWKVAKNNPLANDYVSPMPLSALIFKEKDDSSGRMLDIFGLVGTW